MREEDLPRRWSMGQLSGIRIVLIHVPPIGELSLDVLCRVISHRHLQVVGGIRARDPFDALFCGLLESHVGVERLSGSTRANSTHRSGKHGRRQILVDLASDGARARCARPMKPP